MGTRDELNQKLATEPATINQCGAIHREFARLGFGDEDTRAERLAITAALLGLDDLGSTRDLSMGQAGYLVRLLIETRDRDDLPASASLAPQTGEHQDDGGSSERVSLVTAISRIMLMAFTALNGTGKQPADIRPHIGRLLHDTEDQPADPSA